MYDANDKVSQQCFGVIYNVFYLAEFLHHLGISYQKAKARLRAFR